MPSMVIDNNDFEIDGMEQAINTGNNTSIDDIETENVNLFFIGIDCSSSMECFGGDMQKALADFKDAIINSKEGDSILVERANFNEDVYLTGYLKIADLTTDYNVNGCTSIYDTIELGSKNLLGYAKQLKDNGIRVKMVFAIFSDGEDNASRCSQSAAKQIIKDLNSKEITTAYIAFGNAATDPYIKDLGFKNMLSVGGSASELRKAFNCLSKSVITSSKSATPTGGNSFFQI